MLVKILGSNRIEELELTDSKTGCDWVNDLIGNHDGFGDDVSCQFRRTEDETYGVVFETDEANYDWWEACIANFQKKDYLASLYAEEHGWDAVNEVLYQVGSYDLEDQANAEIAALEEKFGEVEI